MKCIGACCTPEDHASGAPECFECHEPGDEFNLVMDMGNARSAPGLDLVPTFTTNNKRMCLLLATGQMGMLRVEDAERLQACALPCFVVCISCMVKSHEHAQAMLEYFRFCSSPQIHHLRFDSSQRHC